MAYWIFRAIFVFVFKVFFRLKVVGLENLPESNFIIISNHASFLDAPCYIAAIPRKIHCLVLPFLYEVLWLKWFLYLTEAVPIGKSSDKVVELLMRDENVGLYPEGGISPDGKLGEFRRGAALLALRTGRPILPCAILGTFEALPIGAKFPKFVPIKLKIGKPIYVPKEFDEWMDDIYMQEVIMKARNAIQEMLDAG